MPKLTKRIVETAEIREKPYFVYDDLVPGFCARISPSGKRHYYLQYRIHTRSRRIALGQHGIITTEKARAEATQKLLEARSGHDPLQQRIDKRREPIVSDLVERFMEEHVMQHCKLSTQKGYRRYLDKHVLPFFGEMKVTEVTRADVAAFHHSLRRTPYEANRCLEVVSKMFNLAEMWGLRPDGSNPRKHIKKFPMYSRERYLTKAEAKRLGDTLEEIKCYPDENLSAVYCIQLLLLTGCRLGEIKTLRWEYVDHDNGLLRLPDSKTGAKVVYVGDVVLSILDEIWNHPARPADNPYVIWGRIPGTCLHDIQKAWRRFRKMAGLDDLRIHDLRHSFASFAVSKGMSLPMIGKLLGHTQVQTTARYAHLMAEPIKEAASSVTDELSGLLGVEHRSTREKKAPKPEPGTIKGTRVKAPTFLTSDQAAEYLGVKPRLMEHWRWRRTGPTFIKVGNRIRYRLDDLEAFVT